MTKTTGLNTTKELEPVSDKDHIQLDIIEKRIVTLRGKEVILDRDLAYLYNVETKRLNEQVKRNIGRFPSAFMFQLTKDEQDSLRSQSATIKGRGQHSKYPPFAFTEHGVIMLAAILKSEVADRASVAVVNAFVAMRRFMASNAYVFQRLDRIEYKLVESDHKFEAIYSKLEGKTLDPRPRVFFEGQVYDAYKLICDLVQSAKIRVILVDNYVDDSVLTILSKRMVGVTATIYTKSISKTLALDIEKHNSQYPVIDVKIFTSSHDRFLILDNLVYLVGASIKDMGKRWFGISPMPETDPNDLLSRLS